jgi:hypothetical protein
VTAVFLPLMTEDQPDTAERVRWAVQAIPFALPEIQRLEYAGAPAVFRIKDEEAKCP